MYFHFKARYSNYIKIMSLYFSSMMIVNERERYERACKNERFTLDLKGGGHFFQIKLLLDHTYPLSERLVKGYWDNWKLSKLCSYLHIQICKVSYWLFFLGAKAFNYCLNRDRSIIEYETFLLEAL